MLSRSLTSSFVLHLRRFGSWRDAIGRQLSKIDYQVTPDRAILYALGIGCSQSNKGDLRYLYEKHRNFAVFPTFGVIAAQEAFLRLSGIPQISTDLSCLLHGESYFEVLKQLPPFGQQVFSEGRITDILDKKTVGATVILDVETKCAKTGVKLFHNQYVIICRGSGNFGGTAQSEHQRPLLTLSDDERNRTPDAERIERIARDQNALYRLSGDKNPLHIDPDVSRKALGFPQPILHGLCSLGFATRHVLDAFADNKSEFASVKVRFSKPVLPGQTLRTKMWQRPDGSGKKLTVLYRTNVEETGDLAMSGQIQLTMLA